MLRYLVSRSVQAVGIVLGTAAITFVLLYLVPADPAALVAGRSASHEQIESVRHEMGLDRSLPVQFGSYLLHLAEGDFGTSYVQRSPVSRLLLTRLPATLELLAGAIVAQLAIGLTAGIIAAVSRGGIADRLVMIFAFIGVSTPRFVMGILLLYAFAVELDWFPIGGYGGFSNLVLPALTIGVLGGGWYSRMMRSSLIEVLHLDYIRTARAKGAGEMRVVLIHALRNAFLPILAMIGVDMGQFVAGSVVVEAIYGWPGIGQLMWQSIQEIDIPVIMAITLLAAVAITFSNLLVDMITPVLDPRIRLR
ncbi:MAG TPA: ABC transporter permease [Stellaceae bacterium]|jgi:peptide/nickel transport system permease protein|nr:ABC transporter permease [Stellaceae bacterium]